MFLFIWIQVGILYQYLLGKVSTLAAALSSLKGMMIMYQYLLGKVSTAPFMVPPVGQTSINIY